MNLVIKARNLIWNRLLHQIFYLIDEKSSIWEEDWKYLILLDACRYDTFKKVIKEFDIKGTLKRKKSVGCITEEWFTKTFTKDYYPDIIYINSNPVVSKFPNKFFCRVDLWIDKWDDYHNTVLPEEVCKSAFMHSMVAPEKKMIIHFLQPHFPYLLEPQLGREAMDFALGKITNPKTLGSKSFFQLCDWNFYAEYCDRIKDLYVANLRIVLSHVVDLVKKLKDKGKVVITSDHGEAFGERFLFFRVYGHVRARIPAITYVPWFEVEE